MLYVSVPRPMVRTDVGAMSIPSGAGAMVLSDVFPFLLLIQDYLHI